MAEHVWYAAYGSNLSPERLGCYISGGRPAGARRTYPGCRDTTPPSEYRPIQLPGAVLFGADSPVWGGGVAFYDPAATGPSLATAYHLTADQFADVWSQERHRPVGTALALTEVLSASEWAGGAGWYDRIVLAGEIDGEPLLTFTFPADAHPRLKPPSPAYAATIERGLVATHGLSASAAVAYVAGLRQ